MEDKGTDGGWYFVEREAECSDVGESFEEIFDQSDSEHLSLIDDSAAVQGESLSLLHELETQDDQRELAELKRKYIDSPLSRTVEETLSPRLQKVTVTPRKSKKVKKNLFEDSGIAGTSTIDSSSVAPEDEAQGDTSTSDSEPPAPPPQDDPPAAPAAEEPQAEVPSDTITALLKSSNLNAVLHGRFKDVWGVSFAELTRKFSSTKTMSETWTIGVYGLSERTVENAKTLLQEYCDFICVSHAAGERYAYLLALVVFKAQKCKQTIHKLLKTLLLVDPDLVLLDPPKTRSTPVALFWYKRTNIDSATTAGALPDWIARQVLAGHSLAGETNFELSTMVQWAYDNQITEECQIAYGYAEKAGEDPNAMAFLASNQQPKIVRDCAAMVKLYNRAELRNTTMSGWISRRCNAVEDGEPADWKNIVLFLRYQRINFVRFLDAFRRFLRGEPKRCCMALWGVPDSGKSIFAMSLINFMKGKVVTFANSGSQFWLQPLLDTKIGLVDDVTHQCLQYFDVYMRGALDGNFVCIDSKHRNPAQIKMPPMLMTTNVDIASDSNYKYLHSRIVSFEFSEPFPFNDDGTPVYVLNDKTWQCFFKRFWTHLELSDQEDDGETQQTLRLSSRRTSQFV